MEFWNSFNVCNDNNNLLIKEIKSVGGILAIYKYVSASKCLRVSSEFISTDTLSVFLTCQELSELVIKIRNESMTMDFRCG